MIDENKLYSWRPSRCPEALRKVWQEKKNAYLRSGRWRLATGTNALPLLILPKPNKGGELVPLIRTDMSLILRNVIRHKYRSLLDGKDATPDGTDTDELYLRTVHWGLYGCVQYWIDCGRSDFS